MSFAQVDNEAVNHYGDVVTFFNRIPGTVQRNSRFERCRVVKIGVEAAGRRGIGTIPRGAGAIHQSLSNWRRLTLIFRLHLALDLYLGPGSVKMYGNTARHDQ